MLSFKCGTMFQYLSLNHAGVATTDFKARYLFNEDQLVQRAEVGLVSGDAIAIAKALQKIDKHSPLRTGKV
jgi:hypothetical protein